MKAPSIRPVRCAIYTRVSTEYGLDQEFNSLDAQYDAASAYNSLAKFSALQPDATTIGAGPRAGKARTGAWAPGSRRVTATRPTARAATVSWRGGHQLSGCGALRHGCDRQMWVRPVKAASRGPATARCMCD
jgi:hypothetical protein